MTGSDGSAQKRKQTWAQRLQSPWAILAGIGLGVFLGLGAPAWSARLAPLGGVYLSLLQMCVLPLLITAIISSLGRLFTAGHTGSFLARLFAVFILLLLAGGLSSLLMGYLTNPGGRIDQESRMLLGRVLSEAELGTDHRAVATPETGFVAFLANAIPANVFSSLSQGHIVSILFFCILWGMAMAMTSRATRGMALALVDELYEIFTTMLGWVMTALPFGLCCLFADQVTRVGPEMLRALGTFFLAFAGCALALCFLFSLIIWRATRVGYLRSLLALRQALVVALGTSSSLAALPAVLTALRDDLKLDRSAVNLVAPLGVNLNPVGSVVYYVFSAVFVVQFYDASLDAGAIPIVLLGALLAGMAGTSTPGIAAVPLLGIILTPLGLPLEAAVLLLTPLYPAMDPIITLVNVHGNCAATAVIAGLETREGSVHFEAAPGAGEG